MNDRDLIKLADAGAAIDAVLSAADSDDRRDLEAALVLVSDAVEQHGHADWKIMRTWLTVAGDLIRGVVERNENVGRPNS